jgi:hypothetical protein
MVHRYASKISPGPFHVDGSQQSSHVHLNRADRAKFLTVDS